MQNELTTLLFEQQIPSLGNRPLFSKISEVAEAIEKLPAGMKPLRTQSQKSVESYLGQVLRGARRCSDGLREAIFACVVSRLKLGPDESGDWREQVEKAAAQVNLRVSESHRRGEEAFTPEKLYARLLTFSSTAQLQVIVTPASLEEERFSRKADELRNILTSRLNLKAGQRKKSSGRNAGRIKQSNGNVCYQFVLPGVLSAQSFWAGVFYEIIGRTNSYRGWDEVEASKRLNMVDESDDLQVYVAKNSAICSLPVVAFDPDPRRGSRAAFSFCFDKDDVIRIVEWDEVATRAWVDNFYKPFYWQPLDLTRRYRWKEAEAHIRGKTS